MKRDEPRVGAELVDILWVAKRLGVTVRHVRRLVAERRIPLVKWGHLLRFDPREIDTWIDEARRPAGEPPAAERGGVVQSWLPQGARR